MSFFDSDLVQTEMKEISDIQEKVYHNVFRFPQMTNEEKVDHVNLLESLLNRQQVLYTRLSLSDDPEAIQMKEKINESISMVGLPTDIDINIIFNNMSNLIKTMRERIESTSFDQ